MFEPTRARNDRARVRVLQTPGQRELCESRAEFFRKRLQRSRLGQPFRVGQLPPQPFEALQGAPTAFRNAMPVFARQETRGQRAPGRRTQATLPVHALVIRAEPLTFKQVIDRLLNDRFMQMVALGDLDRAQDILRFPFRCPPVQRLAPLDNVVHRPDGFFDRRRRVGAMTKEQIHVIETEAL